LYILFWQKDAKNSSSLSFSSWFCSMMEREELVVGSFLQAGFNRVSDEVLPATQ
jgi:hypothetical protein